MKNAVITGIDLGTDTVKVVVSVIPENQTELRVIGTSTVPMSGMTEGYIVDVDKVTKSIHKALDEVVKSARLRPTEAYVSIGGVTLRGTLSSGSHHIRSSDSIISEDDLEEVIAKARKNAKKELINQKIIHEIPIKYRVDGTDPYSNPLGLRATNLETDLLLIHASENHIDDFVTAVENAGVEVVDVTAAPLAASFASVSTPQKMQGCIVLDIGHETTNIAIFEKNTPLHLSTLSSGSNDITSALALANQLSLQDAENLKKGNLISDAINQKKTASAINKSLDSILTQIKEVIDPIKKERILPAGILLTGGGANLDNIGEIVKNKLKLPVKVVYPNTKHLSGHPEYSVAYGLCVWGSVNAEDTGISSKVKNWSSLVTSWLKQLLP